MTEPAACRALFWALWARLSFKRLVGKNAPTGVGAPLKGCCCRPKKFGFDPLQRDRRAQERLGVVQHAQGKLAAFKPRRKLEHLSAKPQDVSWAAPLLVNGKQAGGNGHPNQKTSIHPCIHPSFHPSIHPFCIYPAVYLSIYPPIYLSICLSFYPSIHLSICTSIYRSNLFI